MKLPASAARSLQLNKVHLTFIQAGFVSSVILDTPSIRGRFRFLANLDEYAHGYSDHFRKQLNYNLDKIAQNGVRKRGSISRPGLPFIRNYGEVRPLPGNELRIRALRGLRGGGDIGSVEISLTDSNGLAPYRIGSNWNISVNKKTKEAFGGVKQARVALSTRILPLGLLWHSLDIFLARISSFDVDHLIAGMNELMNHDSLTVRRGASIFDYCAEGCIREAHRAVLATLTEKPSSHDLELSDIHRMIAPMGLPVGIDLNRHRRELVGLIRLESSWQKLSSSFIQDQLKDTFPGKFENQFLVFHPACTILYTANPAKSEHAESEKHVMWVQKACFHNLREVVAMELLQRYFLGRVHRIFSQLARQEGGSFSSPLIVEESIESLSRVPLYNPEWVPERLCRGHRTVFHGIDSALGIRRIAEKVVNSRRVIDLKLYRGGGKVVSIAEQQYAREVVGQLGEIARISGEIADKSPFGFDKQTLLADTLRGEASTLQAKLDAQIDLLANIALDAPEYERTKSAAQLNRLVLQDYGRGILPKFDELITSLAQDPDKLKAAVEDSRKKKAAVPSAENVDASLKEVAQNLEDVKRAKAGLQGETRLDNFVRKVKPWADGLLKVAGAILTALGVVH